MEINTLIIGYVPLADTAGKKPREIRDDKYFRELLSGFDLGNVHYSNQTPINWQKKIDEVNPIIIIYLGGEYYAGEVKKYKDDALMYVADDAGSVFYRKAEIEKKREKHQKIFTEIGSIVKKLKDDGEKELEGVRKFAAMTYDDMYKMIQKAIIGDDKDLSKKAWELLMNKNGHSDFVWMRAQLVVECWQASNAKQKEEFLNLAMKDHIDNGLARELAIHTDEEGIQYRQYEFIYPNGQRTYYVRRIPIVTKEMEKYGYENLLDKYETPNGAQMLLEVGQMKNEMKKYTDVEAEKIYRVLKEWKADPNKTQRELNIVDPYGVIHNEPLKERHVEAFKKTLKAWAEDKYLELFPA